MGREKTLEKVAAMIFLLDYSVAPLGGAGVTKIKPKLQKNCSDGRMDRASASGAVDTASITSWVKPMTLNWN